MVCESMVRFPICTPARRLLACASMDFEIVGEITSTETIASGSGVRERARLRRQYGQGRWRKRKGVARVRLIDGTLCLAEIHWYEAHGIGRRRKGRHSTACGHQPKPSRSCSRSWRTAAHCKTIVVAFGFDERTVAAWWARSGRQGQAVQECLVEQPRDLGHVQADEIRVKKQGGIVWMALAMMVKTRLWLGGEVSEQRDMPLIRRLIERVRRCAAHRPLLVCTDGLVSYIRAVRETFRDPVHTGTGGRPRLRPWRTVFIEFKLKLPFLDAHR